MLVPLEWLKQYTDAGVDADVFCEKMVMSGSNIESVMRYGGELEKVVVGRILSVEKHGNSDHLLVTRVDAGLGEPLQIITGAPNTFAGALVPVALPGGSLPGGVRIKKGKLRGMESEGMLCSAAELGFADKVVPLAHKDGIWILEGDYAPGEDFAEALRLREVTVDFEITPNRPDCLSIIGMAREAAAVFETPLFYPETLPHREGGKAREYIDVVVKNPELCPRYIARIAANVRIKQSPWWMQKRLMYAGMRPINNIVDISNYVMLEYGHPIHAFDIRNIEGGKIIVDTAEEGRRFTTLDGAERVLPADTLMINDGVKAVAVAGVMGGLNSEIRDDTAMILIEAANFNGDSVRLTSKKLGLRTEASSRYEKGVDPGLAEEAVERVCFLIEQLGAGEMIAGSVDVYPDREKRDPIPARVDRVNRVLGTGMKRRDMEDILKRLEMRVAGSGNVMEVLPPSVRQDLRAEEDVIEEIARIYGYDRLETTLPKGNSTAGMPAARGFTEFARDVLSGAGYSEIQTYSFARPESAEWLNVPEGAEARRFVRILNPLGDENSAMRTMLLPNMLETLGRNCARNIEAARAYEIGGVFFRDSGGELPRERRSMAVGAYGGSMDFYELKGVLDILFGSMGVRGVSYEAESGNAAFHPGRCARISRDGGVLGVMGELHPDVAEKYGICARCYVCELDFGAVIAGADTMSYYKPLPKYPAVFRDVALLVDERVTVKSIETVIKTAAGKNLESLSLFDVYRGEQVPDGMKSAAFNLVYRSPERTLTDEEAAEDCERVLDALRRELNAVLREV